MRLKLRHLEVFNALIDAGSVSRAAERLNLSQPAVSIALANLEEELGYRLFHRDRGFFSPTNEATLLLEDVQRGLDALARIEQRSNEIRTGASGSTLIGSNGATALNLLPQVISRFQSDNPGSFVELRIHSSRHVASWVTSRQVDIGLIDVPVPVAGLSTEIYAMECVCVMREESPLARRDVITPEDLRGEKVIGITGNHPVDVQLDQVMIEADVPLTRTASAYYYAIVRNMVAAGCGVSVIDPVNGMAALGDGVVWRPFLPVLHHELAVITARDYPLGRPAAKMHDRLRNELGRFSVSVTKP